MPRGGTHLRGWWGSRRCRSRKSSSGERKGGGGKKKEGGVRRAPVCWRRQYAGTVAQCGIDRMGFKGACMLEADISLT
jgi:hypothetical protein